MSVHKILFITSTRIGDAVLSTGLLDYLLRTHPEARVTIACGPQAAPLFEAVPRLDKVIAMVKEPRAGHWIRLWRDCVGQRWDMVVDLRRSVIPYLLRTNERHMLNHSHERIHRVRQIADVFDLPEPPTPKIWIADKHREMAARLLAGKKPILALGPTTNWTAKTWAADNFFKLFECLSGTKGILPGARVAVFGAPTERDQAQPLLDALPEERCIDLIGKVDLLTAYACLERCGFFVGNDSSLMHLAAASGIPTLGLFGPTEEVYYAPWGWNTTVVRTPESVETIFPADFDHRNTGSLMNGLTVERAEQAARALWQREAA